MNESPKYQVPLKDESLYNAKKIALHLGLFLLTLLSTTLTGAEYMYASTFAGVLLPEGSEALGWAAFWAGLQYSVPFLLILTVHEFGHFFAARYHRVKVTLPYYLPFYIPGLPQFGTFGAVIKIKEALRSRRILFDVGVAGPLAGFVVALGVLCYGFTHLPPPSYVFNAHPEWAKYGDDYAKYVYQELGPQMMMSTNLLFELLKTLLVEDTSLLPPPQEMMHYPFLLAGYFACFFTAINLLPIGQLDGGHILYGLAGKKGHRLLSPLFFILLLFWGGLGTLSLFDDLQTLIWGIPVYVFFLYYLMERMYDDKITVLVIATAIFLVQFVVKSYLPTLEGFRGWLFFGLLLGRFMGVHHPESPDDTPLDTKRKVLGWISIIVFILCFAPVPFDVGE